MPRDTLTRDQIVSTAIELLDAEGLDGLNMRDLGKRLNSAATAVYWHVGNKAGLITLAADQIWQNLPLPDLEVDWRTAVTTMATDLHAALTKHPWLVQAFGTYFVYGHGKARYDDHGLAVFEAAGFTGTQADQAMATVFTYVLGNALGPAAMDSITRKLSREGAEDSLNEAMANATEIATQYPRLSARLETAAADYAGTPDNTFEFGLQAILTGLALWLVEPG